jgi:replicative DNA helicase
MVQTQKQNHRLFESAQAKLAQCDSDNRRVIAHPYGFADLDSLTDGLRPAEVTLIGGAPGDGSTALALGIAEKSIIADRNNIPVRTLFFSLQSAKEQIATRMLFSLARVCPRQLRAGMFSPDGVEMGRLAEATKLLAGAPLELVDEPHMTIETVGQRAKELHGEAPIGFIIIDGVHLLGPTESTRGMPREQQVGEISRGLKNLSKELRVPVLATCQLTPAPVRAGRSLRPEASDLKDGGGLESDADVVILLAPARDDQKQFVAACSETDVIVAKNRNGPKGEMRLTFLAEICRYENYHQ